MTFTIGKRVKIHKSARINVDHGHIGCGTIIRKGVIIEGTHIEIGRESYLDIRARIGGGSCFGKASVLTAGDFFHMGVDSHVNIARRVSIGHEVGLGVGTKIFTHGAYLSAWNGYPVKFARVEIGSSVWLPNAWVNPGVSIGNNVVVAAGSVVNKDIPSGSLAGGVPAKIIQVNMFPKELHQAEKSRIINLIWNTVIENGKFQNAYLRLETLRYYVINNDTYFDIDGRTIHGPATPLTEAFKNELRRNGIRFRYGVKNGEYRSWNQIY